MSIEKTMRPGGIREFPWRMTRSRRMTYDYTWFCRSCYEGCKITVEQEEPALRLQCSHCGTEYRRESAASAWKYLEKDEEKIGQ